MIDLQAIFGDDRTTETTSLPAAPSASNPAPVVIHVEQVGNELRLCCPTPEIAAAIEAGRETIERLLVELMAEPPAYGSPEDWVLTRDCKGRWIWERAGLEDWEAWWRRWDEDEMFARPVMDFEKPAALTAPDHVCDDKDDT